MLEVSRFVSGDVEMNTKSSKDYLAVNFAVLVSTPLHVSGGCCIAAKETHFHKGLEACKHLC